MNKVLNYFAAAIIAAILMVVAFNGAAFGQTDNTKTVGIDPAKNTVQLPNNAANPLSVKVENVRKPFQKRISVAPLGNGFSGVPLQIPAGKRLVIENVSVVGRIPEGLKLEVNFFTYMDNDGNGVNDPEDLTFHRIPMTEQGVFDGTAISAFNQKMLVFADGSIGNSALSIVAQARLNGSVPANTFTQVQFTFSGYLEDLPTAQ